jgi:hypothetical protein
MTSRTRLKVAFYLNCLLLVLELYALLNCYFGFIGNGGQGAFMFHFFTESSNALLALTTLLMLVYLGRALFGNHPIPKAIMIIRLIGVAATMTTFWTVFIYLEPACLYFGWGLKMFSFPNMFFTHLTCPLLGLASFLFFEPVIPYKNRWAVSSFALISVFTYAAIIIPLASLKLLSSDPNVNNVYAVCDATVHPWYTVLAVSLVFLVTYFGAFLYLYLQKKIQSVPEKHV